MSSHVFQTLGNVEILSQRKVALFASRHTPPEVYPAAEELFRALCALNIALAGGWQAPLEKRLWKLFDYKTCKANLMYYLARDLNGYTPDRRAEALLDRNRLLFVAPSIRTSRPSRKEIQLRDTLVFSQVKKVVFLYVHPTGRLASYLRQASRMKHDFYLLDHPVNQQQLREDTVAIAADDLNLLFSDLA